MSKMKPQSDPRGFGKRWEEGHLFSLSPGGRGHAAGDNQVRKTRNDYSSELSALFLRLLLYPKVTQQ